MSKTLFMAVKKGARISKSSQETAKQFGMIKSISAAIREGLGAVMPDYRSKPVMFAMDAIIRRWYIDIYLKGKAAENTSPYFRDLNLTGQMTGGTDLLLGVRPLVEKTGNQFRLMVPQMFPETMLLPNGCEMLSPTFTVCGTRIDDRGPALYHSIQLERVVESPMEGFTLETMPFLQMGGNYLYLAFLSCAIKPGEGGKKKGNGNLCW